MSSVWSYIVPAGGKWSGRMGKGKLLRFTATQGGANLSLLLYNARDLAERYNMPDTLKAQHTSHLTAGHVLMSDNGRVLASIVADSLGWHDPLAGFTTRETTDAKYGVTRYQVLHNGWLRSGRENLSMELVRNGLSVRDLVPPVNLFSKVVCDERGEMRWEDGHCQAGAAVTLRTEMDVLVVLSNTPNPLDERVPYPSVPVKLEVMPAAPVSERDDECLNSCPENRRAFENTWSYDVLVGD